MRYIGWLAAILVISTGGGCASQGRVGDPAMGNAGASLADTGRDIAERECATCHAVHRTDVSPRDGAPPLRDILKLYDSDLLSNDLIEGIRTGHENMPVFDFDVRTTDALLAYMRSLEGKRSKNRGSR